MRKTMVIDLGGVIFALGIVFWLAGGANWVEEKTRQLRLDNDLKEAKLIAMKSEVDQAGR